MVYEAGWQAQLYSTNLIGMQKCESTSNVQHEQTALTRPPQLIGAIIVYCTHEVSTLAVQKCEHFSL